ncbi:hypothetical protein JYT72_03115, partial [Crocinitomix catalasitica]|nr:hypothetical protein [Crocinitomix catalasitica]
SNGNITKVTVPINVLYWIRVEKDGWCIKTFYLDTRHEKPEELPRIITFNLDDRLFKVTDNAFKFMEEEPMREFFFDHMGSFTWKQYDGQRADRKVKLVHLNHVPEGKADKYIDLMEEAEKLEKDGKKAEALKIFKKARGIHPSTEVDEAIERLISASLDEQ